MRHTLVDLTRTLKDIRDRMNPTPYCSMPYNGFNPYYYSGMVSGTSSNFISNSGNLLNPNNPISAVSQPFSQALPGVFHNPPPGFSNSAYTNAQFSELRNQSAVSHSQPQPVAYEQPSQPIVDEQRPYVQQQPVFANPPTNNFNNPNMQQPMQS